MADRVARVQTLISKNISSIILYELKNPKVGFVTVTEVEVARDFSFARVYCSFLGAKYPKQNLEELNKCKGFIKTSLSKKLDIWKIPNLEFVLDDSFEKAEEIDKLLSKEAEDLAKLKK